MEKWDIFAGSQGVRYRLGRSGPAGHKRQKAGTGTKKTKNTTGESLDRLPPRDELNALDLNTSSLSAFGYVFQIDTQNIAVGSNVTFSDNGPLNGINHTPGSPTIEVTLDGIYNIVFSIYTTQNNPQDWAVVINGLPQSRFTSAGQTITAAATLDLNAQDRVTIRNVNTIPDPATLREGDFITAYVMIYKVDN